MLIDQQKRAKLIDGINYPRSSFYYYDYGRYVEAPIKVILDREVGRGDLLSQSFIRPDDRIIEEIYVPAEITTEFAEENIFIPLEGKVAFCDMRNTGSDILGDHYIQYSIFSEGEVAKNDDGTYYVPAIDLKEDGTKQTKRFRIYPHPGHKKLSDIMKWGHCYTFDEKVNGWVYDNDKRNHLIKYKKGVVKIRISDEFGDEWERISDISKLIYWLMAQHKEKLSESQRFIIEKIKPDEKQLTKILNRDNQIFDFIKDYFNEDIPSHYQFEL